MNVDLDEFAMVTPAELARALHISTATLRRMTASGHLPKSVQLSPRRHAWRKQDIRKWMSDRQRD